MTSTEKTIFGRTGLQHGKLPDLAATADQHGSQQHGQPRQETAGAERNWKVIFGYRREAGRVQGERVEKNRSAPHEHAISQSLNGPLPPIIIIAQ